MGYLKLLAKILNHHFWLDHPFAPKVQFSFFDFPRVHLNLNKNWNLVKKKSKIIAINYFPPPVDPLILIIDSSSSMKMVDGA